MTPARRTLLYDAGRALTCAGAVKSLRETSSLPTLDGIWAGEPGTLIYVSHAVQDAANVRVFYELYANRSAFEAHEEQPHTRRFLDQRPQFVESFTVDFLDAVDGKGPQPSETP